MPWINLTKDEAELARAALSVLTVPAAASAINRITDALEQDPALHVYADAVETDDELEVDEDPIISRGADPGAWVMAWVWVSDEDAGVEEEETEDFFVEEVEPGLFQSIFPAKLSHLSQLHTSAADAWTYIRDHENDEAS